jgi:F0F1-type ATP synthase membrane subunit c/vacuolar-type H+-ATPase subunit K
MPRFLNQPRRALGVGALVALAAAAAVALAVGGCAGHSTRPAAQAPTRTRPLETIFEAQPELFASPGPTLDILKRLGVDRVKVFVP